MPILDHRGNPINLRDLEEEHARPTSVGIRSIWRQPQVKGLTPAKLARILRAVDGSNQCDEYLVLAEEMEEKDLHYAAELSKRKLAVARLTPKLEAPTDDELDVELAEFCGRIVRTRQFKAMLLHAMDALGKGYSMIEIMWDLGGKYWVPRAYKWRDPRFFRFELEDMETPRLLTVENMDPGIPLPAFKFVYHLPEIKSGIPLRGGLARLAAFAFMCKSYSVKDWMAFAEVFGMPLRLGRYDPGASEQDITVLKRAIQDLGHDAGAVVPKSMLIEFVDAARMSGSSSSDPVFGKLATFLNNEISIGILGQTASASGTPGRLGNDDTQAQVREDIRDHDADQLAGTIQRDIINPMVDLNFGPREADGYPIFSLAHEKPEDLKAFSDSITPLIKAGLRVEAQAVRDKWGLDMPAEDAEIIGGKPAAPIAPVPGDDDDEGEELTEGEALQRMLHALAPGVADEIEVLTDKEARRWREQLEPLVKPIFALASRSQSYGDFTDQLDGVLGEMDDKLLIERLATTTLKARGLGDARDSPAALASMSVHDAVALMAESTTVQSLVFDKEQFTHAAAEAWARGHGFKATKTDETESSYRLRQREPGDFVDGSFRTITLTDGVKAVVGRLKG